MKYKQILLLGLFLSFIISCGDTEKKEIKNSEQLKMINRDFVKTFEGSINDKYEILMKINCNNGNITGKYFYKTKGTEIEAKGNLNEKGEILINEFDNNGNQTGIFSGLMSNENKIIGNWSKPNGTNKMSFNLLESNSNYETTINNINDSKNINISGNYDSPFNEDGVSFGNVKINYLNNSKFSFEITVITGSGNIGEIKGIGKLSNGIGKYSAKGCEALIFEFNKQELAITEKNCESNHGMGAYFSGKYIK